MLRFKAPNGAKKKRNNKPKKLPDTHWLYSLYSDMRNMRLMDAVRDGDLKKARELIEKGADPNVKIVSGGTALSLARKKGDREMFELLKTARPAADEQRQAV